MNRKRLRNKDKALFIIIEIYWTCLNIYWQDMHFFLEIMIREENKHIQSQLSIYSMLILFCDLFYQKIAYKYTNNVCICIQIYENSNFQIARWTEKVRFLISFSSPGFNLFSILYLC